MVQRGRWGGVVRQGRGHFKPAVLHLREERRALRVVDGVDVDRVLVRAVVEDVERLHRRLTLLPVPEDEVDPLGQRAAHVRRLERLWRRAGRQRRGKERDGRGTQLGRGGARACRMQRTKRHALPFAHGGSCAWCSVAPSWRVPSASWLTLSSASGM